MPKKGNNVSSPFIRYTDFGYILAPEDNGKLNPVAL